MVKCTFCETEIPKGSGMIYVYKSGKLANFCSMKCEKHTLILKRKARNTKWVTSEKK
ncbi:MAG: 50S ribosomal protein L24e [Nanoarchaeota archaeon]|nr:50S ribosomal protein L24e [Nanoarchaeota archaeon]